MSDGPFKSSRLRKGWQDVGDRADNSNFESADIYDAIASAVKTDLEQDVSPQLLTSIRGALADAAQGSLFGDQEPAELVPLMREAAGLPLATLLVECARQALSEGLTGEAALVEAVSNAMAEWCVRQARGIEEHALRENLTHERRRNINQRIENAIRNTDGLARQLLKIDTSVSTGRKPPKQGGLDDGVPIDGR